MIMHSISIQSCGLFVDELTALTIRAEFVLVILLAELCLVVLGHICFLFEFMISMSERAMIIELTSACLLPIFTHLSLILNFEWVCIFGFQRTCGSLTRLRAFVWDHWLVGFHHACQIVVRCCSLICQGILALLGFLLSFKIRVWRGRDPALRISN